MEKYILLFIFIFLFLCIFSKENNYICVHSKFITYSWLVDMFTIPLIKKLNSGTHTFGRRKKLIISGFLWSNKWLRFPKRYHQIHSKSIYTSGWLWWTSSPNASFFYRDVHQENMQGVNIFTTIISKCIYIWKEFDVTAYWILPSMNF